MASLENALQQIEDLERPFSGMCRIGKETGVGVAWNLMRDKIGSEKWREYVTLRRQLREARYPNSAT